MDQTTQQSAAPSSSLVTTSPTQSTGVQRSHPYPTLNPRELPLNIQIVNEQSRPADAQNIADLEAIILQLQQSEDQVQARQVATQRQLDAASARVIAGAAVVTHEMTQVRHNQEVLGVQAAQMQRESIKVARNMAVATEVAAAGQQAEERAIMITGRIRAAELRANEAENQVAANQATLRAQELSSARQQQTRREVLEARQEQVLIAHRKEAALFEAQAKARHAGESLERGRVCARDGVAPLDRGQLQSIINESIKSAVGEIIRDTARETCVAVGGSLPEVGRYHHFQPFSQVPQRPTNPSRSANSSSISVGVPSRQTHIFLV